MRGELSHRERLYERLDALFLAGGDFYSVLMTARYLQRLEEEEETEQVPLEARRILETGLFVTYARPFCNKPPRHVSLLKGLSEELQKTHQEALKRRNTVYAHTDDAQLRRMIELRDQQSREAMLREQWGSELHEEWSGVTTAGLDDVAELAAVHLGKVLSEIETVRSRVMELGDIA
jgi:hypothetical protein